MSLKDWEKVGLYAFDDQIVIGANGGDLSNRPNVRFWHLADI